MVRGTRREVNINMLRCHLPDIEITVLSSHTKVKRGLRSRETKHEAFHNGPEQYLRHGVYLHRLSDIDAECHVRSHFLLAVWVLAQAAAAAAAALEGCTTRQRRGRALGELAVDVDVLAWRLSAITCGRVTYNCNSGALRNSGTIICFFPYM